MAWPDTERIWRAKQESMERPIDEVRRDLGVSEAAQYPIFHMADAPGAPDLPPSPN